MYAKDLNYGEMEGGPDRATAHARFKPTSPTWASPLVCTNAKLLYQQEFDENTHTKKNEQIYNHENTKNLNDEMNLHVQRHY